MLQGCFVPVSLPHCGELMMAPTPELPWQAARNIWPESQWHWTWAVKKGEKNKKPKAKISNRSKKQRVLMMLWRGWTLLNSLPGPGASLCTTGRLNWPSVIPAAADWLRSTGFSPWLIKISEAKRASPDGMLPSQPWRGNHRLRGNTQMLFHYYKWGFSPSVCVCFFYFSLLANMPLVSCGGARKEREERSLERSPTTSPWGVY